MIRIGKETSRDIKARGFLADVKYDFRYNKVLLFFLVPAVIIFFIFCYVPIYGIQIAFKDFVPFEGIWGSKWVGLDQFARLFRSFQFEDIISNTLILSLLGLVCSFPVPIFLALMLNMMGNKKFKHVLQTTTYMPYFISTVVLVGMVVVFLSPSLGLYGHVARLLGNNNPPNIMGNPNNFRPVYILSGIWQSAGWESIIYLAALSSVDVQLYEAATVDGANKLQKAWHIDLPAVLPTLTILLILSAGNIMNVGFEKTYLLQNGANLQTSEIIATYTYKIGLLQHQYSYSAAIGLFNNVVNLVLLLGVNAAARRISETSLM